MYKLFFLLIAPLLIFACGNKTAGNKTADNNPVDTASNNPPVETKAPNSSYKPAFKGQTRAPGVKTTTPYEGKVLTDKLNSPWGITQLPDGRFLITQKEGTMRIATNTGELSEPITGLPPVVNAGQGGLLGVTIDPQFESNRMVYWAFSEKTPEGNLTAIAKGKLAANEKHIENATVIYRATPAYNGTLHYGGRILFDGKGNLFISTGERSDLQTRPQAQLLNSALGKVIRITTDGKPAAGNPFLNRNDARPELYSYGHRNVQSLAIHPATGDLWEAEFGPRGGDEVNRIEPGKNYGWATITYGLEYSGQKVGEGITQHEGMEQPVYYWDPVVSPSGIAFYRGNAIPEWENNLFVGCLNIGHIDRLVIKDNKIVGEERLLEDKHERFRDLASSNGVLYAVTDGGNLYRISKDDSK
jgi:glucose/arabinose dehydrogenase